VSTLKVKGRAEGETAEFLKFIEQSPVAAQIDHFTENMRASGKGHLEIALLIPLEEARLGDSRIDGTYTFLANEVTVDPALPPLQQVKGSLQFSEKDLRVPEINALLFGGPLRIKGGNAGRQGADHRQRYAGHRRLAATPGTCPCSTISPGRPPIVPRCGYRSATSNWCWTRTWSASLRRCRRRWARAPSEAMPLHFETALLPATARVAPAIVRDQLRATLGNVSSACKLIRRKQAKDAYPERVVRS
jgi:hypothetical protein